MGNIHITGKKVSVTSNPLLPNISMHILLAVLYTFPKVPTRRICLTIKIFLVGDYFLYSREFRVVIVKRNQMLITLRSQRVDTKRILIRNVLVLYAGVVSFCRIVTLKAFGKL